MPPSASCKLPESDTTFNCCNPPVALIVIPVVELVSVTLEPCTSFLSCNSAPTFCANTPCPVLPKFVTVVDSDLRSDHQSFD